jgi:hypothetical protein
MISLAGFVVPAVISKKEVVRDRPKCLEDGDLLTIRLVELLFQMVIDCDNMSKRLISGARQPTRKRVRQDDTVVITPNDLRMMKISNEYDKRMRPI